MKNPLINISPFCGRNVFEFWISDALSLHFSTHQRVRQDRIEGTSTLPFERKEASLRFCRLHIITAQRDHNILVSLDSTNQDGTLKYHSSFRLCS